MSSNTTENSLRGWVSSPDGRGSLDIVWTCLATIFLSTWSAIFLNVPNPSDTVWTYIKRKTFLTIVTIMGPEYLLMFAIGEWQSARASVTRFKALRGDDLWTLRHGFFANMGGFALKTSDDACFFLDAAQIAWLLERGAVSRAQFDERFLLDAQAIEDRNKSDLFMRVVAVAQALWFCVNMVARAAQGLAISTLEITTVGIIIDSILVYWVWKEKPADVEWVEYVYVDMSIPELLALEPSQAAREPGYITPLDFVSREIWSSTIIYNYMRNILKNFRGSRKQDTEGKSMGRRSDNDSPPITGIEAFFVLVAGMAFFGVNFIAWNFHFPTDIEKWMWRGSSIGLVVVGWGIYFYFERWHRGERLDRMQQRARRFRQDLSVKVDSQDRVASNIRYLGRVLSWVRKRAIRATNNSPNQDPHLDVSISFLMFGLPFFVLYIIFRMYLLVEDAIAFRYMPTTMFETVDWMKFVPHFG